MSLGPNLILYSSFDIDYLTSDFWLFYNSAEWSSDNEMTNKTGQGYAKLVTTSGGMSERLRYRATPWDYGKTYQINFDCDKGNTPLPGRVYFGTNIVGTFSGVGSVEFTGKFTDDLKLSFWCHAPSGQLTGIDEVYLYEVLADAPPLINGGLVNNSLINRGLIT